MQLAPLPQHDRQVVQGYGKGGFRVSDKEWRGPIIVLPIRTMAWDVVSASSLTLGSFDLVSAAADPPIELLLVGTGAKLFLLPSSLRAEIRALGLAIDIMDTGAACRTYNILIGEERRVAAALLPVG
jgi:uncharacterized protein